MRQQTTHRTHRATTDGSEETPSGQELGLQRQIRTIVGQVSREKLLPKILWNAARELGSKKLIGYQKSVRRQYENQLRCPAKYDPEEAKSDRQKFREKVVRLMNNQLEVDYLQNVKLKDRTLVTYHGHELEECPVPTKKEFEIFRNFNERRFKETTSNIFEDQLELDYPNLYQNKTSKRCQTLHVLENREHKVIHDLRSNQSPITVHQNSSSSTTARQTPRKRQPLIQSARKKQLIYFNEKKTVGPPIPHDEAAAVTRIIRQVKRFDDDEGMRKGEIRVSKQAALRWMRELYEKPRRITDFLQLGDTLRMDQFWGISKKLRVMPLDHIQFMSFLFLDANNDGYICDYDLERLSNLALTRPVLKHDYQRIKQSNIKKLLTKKQPYLQLYKLSELTETHYFQWKKEQAKKMDAEIQKGGLELQMKNRVLSSKQKHIFIDFQAFCHIYRTDKPFLWYDLMMIFSGSAFQGLKYQ